MSCVWLWNNDSSHWLASDIYAYNNGVTWYSLWDGTKQLAAKEMVDIYTGDTNSTVGTGYYAYHALNCDKFAAGTSYVDTSWGWLQGKLATSLYSGTKDWIIGRNFHFPWSEDDSHFSGGNTCSIQVYKRGGSISTKSIAKHVDCSAFNDDSEEATLTRFRYASGTIYPEYTWKKCNPIYFEQSGDMTGMTITAKLYNVITSESGSTSSYTLGSFTLNSSTTSKMKYMPTYCEVELTFSYSSSASCKKYVYFNRGSTYSRMFFINPGDSYSYTLRPSDFGLNPGYTGWIYIMDAGLVNQYTCDVASPNTMFYGLSDEIVVNYHNFTQTCSNGYTVNSSYLYPNYNSNIHGNSGGDITTGFGIGVYKNYSSSSSSAWESVRDNYYARKPFNLYEQSITSSEFLLIPATSRSNANSFGTLFKDSSGKLVNITSFDFSNGKNYVTSSNSRTYYVLCPCWNFKNKCSTDITVKTFNWTVPKSDTGYAIPAKRQASIVVTNNSTSTQNIYIDDVLIATLAAGESHTETKTPDPGNVLVIRNEASSTNKIRINGEWKDAVAYVRVGSEWKQCTAYVWKDNSWHKTS